MYSHTVAAAVIWIPSVPLQLGLLKVQEEEDRCVGFVFTPEVIMHSSSIHQNRAPMPSVIAPASTTDMWAWHNCGCAGTLNKEFKSDLCHVFNMDVSKWYIML